MDYVIPIRDLWFVENNQIVSSFRRTGIDIFILVTLITIKRIIEYEKVLIRKKLREPKKHI